MKKLLLITVTILTTLCAHAQFSVMTTVSSVEDEAGETTYNFTDKIGVGYDVNEKLMVGLTMDGEDKYELLGRYALTNGVWGTCVYNYEADSDTELMNNIELGLGYSFNIWDKLYIEPNYTIPAKENEAGDREGTLNLSVSYKF